MATLTSEFGCTTHCVPRRTGTGTPTLSGCPASVTCPRTAVACATGQ